MWEENVDDKEEKEKGKKLIVETNVALGWYSILESGAGPSLCLLGAAADMNQCVKTITAVDKIPQNTQHAQCVYAQDIIHY